MMQPAPHLPVLLAEVLHYLAPRDGEVFVDGTFGAGGYSRAILEAAECTVYGIDRDPTVKPHADRLAADFPGRFKLLAGCFGDMEALLAAEGVSRVDGVVLDIGVSSMQLDEAARGFSFQADGPLDMRMGAEGPTAAELVNKLEAEELADIIYKYGEERHSRRIARAIVAMRAKRPFARTRELAEVVERAIPGGAAKKGGIHPATRTFQALRIAVNEELSILQAALRSIPDLMNPGGRIAIISFHSLEDRIVKQAFRDDPRLEVLTRKPLRPTDAEVDSNPRSRSAKLRVAERRETDSL